MYPNAAFTSAALPQAPAQTEAQHSTSSDSPHTGMSHGHTGVVSLSPFPQPHAQVPAPDATTRLIEVSNLGMGIGSGPSFMSSVGLHSLLMHLGKIPPLGRKCTTLTSRSSHLLAIHSPSICKCHTWLPLGHGLLMVNPSIASATDRHRLSPCTQSLPVHSGARNMLWPTCWISLGELIYRIAPPLSSPSGWHSG